MLTDTRIQDDPGLANRYLAGQLSPAELQAYEQHLIENPDAVSELEATARMKAGIASLRDSGQLEELLRAPSAVRPRWPALAAAAALLVLALGLWRGMDAPSDATVVATATELLDRSGRPFASGSSYALLRLRSSADDAVIELPPDPRAIELRMHPETSAPLYSATLSQIQDDGSVMDLGNVAGLKAQNDGFVRLYVDSSRLEAGPYLLTITPAGDYAGASAETFRVRVLVPEGQR